MDIYSTAYLNGLVDNLKRPQAFLLNRFFPMVVQSEAEEIKFDVAEGKRRISPFVSPLVQGKLVESLGYKTSTFKPAYVKDKRVIDPNKPLKRAAGEAIGGVLSAANREQAILTMEVADQTEMLTRRLEVMAAEALRTGKVTVSGEGYDTVVVDFGRNPTHTETLGSGSKWGETNVDPLEDIEDRALVVLKNSGAQVTDVIMGVDAWRQFRAADKVKDQLDVRRMGTANSVDGVIAPVPGAVYQGRIGQYNFWTYSDWYIDDSGNEVALWPSDGVLLASEQVEGARHFGAIRDPKAGYQAREIFTKSWITEDPAVRYLMAQSAPLVVPYRPDATYFMDVL